MKQKLLIITASYPPDNVPGAQRVFALAKYIDKNRFDVKVITLSNPFFHYGINEELDPTLDNVELIKIKSKLGSRTNYMKHYSYSAKRKKTIVNKFKLVIINLVKKLMYPDKGMFWSPNVIRYLKQNEEIITNTDYIYSSSPNVTDHIIAQFVKQRNNKVKWIADFRDFHYLDNMQFKQGALIAKHKKLEAKIVKDASIVTFVTQTMQQVYQSFYPQYAYKMHAVYSGLEKSDFSKSIDIERRIDNSKITIFYAGSFYNGLRSPLPLLKIIDMSFNEKLLNSEQIKIQIAGNIDEHTINEMRGYKSFECVDFLGNLPRADVLKYMTNATFNWLIVANIKSHYQTVPIKLFEYIAARRPIINFAPDVSEPTQIILDNDLGYNFNTLEFIIENNYLIFENIVNKFYNGEFSMPLPKENLDAFAWENQIKKIEYLMKEPQYYCEKR